MVFCSWVLLDEVRELDFGDTRGNKGVQLEDCLENVCSVRDRFMYVRNSPSGREGICVGQARPPRDHLVGLLASQCGKIPWLGMQVFWEGC